MMKKNLLMKNMGCNMDKQIIKFIKKYDISDLEIKDIVNIAPMLEVTSYEEFIDNCKLLVEYGYPQSDLDVLLLANTNIFVKSFKDLKEDLETLSSKVDDIEEILKENPTII